MKTNKAKCIFGGTPIKVGDIIFIGKRRCILQVKIHKGVEDCDDCAISNERECFYFPCSDIYPKEIKGGL